MTTTVDNNKDSSRPGLIDNVSQASSSSPTGQELFPRKPDLAALRNMRILLVDDLPTNIILAQAILEHGGFRNVITAESGDRALQVLDKQTQDGACKIDVVLLDIILPGKNGYSVCRSIRQHAALSHIPVIMITSDTKWKEETALAAFESGATDILFKPVRSAELIPRVISALSLKTERDNRIESEKHFLEKSHEHTLLEARLKYLVSHDDLTGLYNRRRLEQLLELSIAYAQNYERSCALLCLDINNFNGINSNKGFPAADKLLEEVAVYIKDFSEDYHAARIGKDIFAILIDDCTEDVARTVSLRLMSLLNSNQFESIGEQVSFRAGLAHTDECINKEQLSAGEMISLAETACQNAKQETTTVSCFKSPTQED